MSISDHNSLYLHPESTELLNTNTTLIVKSCIEWFNSHEDRLDMLIKILSRKAPFSLRLLDWMVTNFTLQTRLTVTADDGTPIDIYNDYQRFLTVYNKRYFDPFARRTRIILIKGGRSWSTTVGQINFMRWFLERRLDVVVCSHQSDIEQHMKTNAPPQGTPLTSCGVSIHKGPFSMVF